LSDLIRITRDELFAEAVDRALERERRLRDPLGAGPSPISPLRALLMSSLFYMPAAGLLAGLVAWLLIEPHFRDFETLGGEVVLVNWEPFEFALDGETEALSLTVGTKEVVVIPGETLLEEGADGQAPFADWEEIEAGASLEATGEALDQNRLVAMAVRPASPERAQAAGQILQAGEGAAAYLFFPVTATLIALALILAEGISSRNWLRMADRALLGTILTAVFSFLAFVPAGLALLVGQHVLEAQEGFVTVDILPVGAFLVFSAARSAAWACIGAALGVGMNLARSTKAQLRNSVVGGALGGALGGAFFDPIDRFATGSSVFTGGEVPRLVGMMAVGTCVGVFVALVDRLAREAWLRVRTGPLAGKSFVLYRTPTLIGSAPQSDIYLFKDAEIEATHAAIHRAGNVYEIEDLGGRSGVRVGDRPVQRRRLASGDQIVLGATVLEFEERTKRGRSDV
jgi:hypothetical protein